MSADPAAWILRRTIATTRGEIAWDVGHQLWLRNVRGFDEQDTAEFEPLLGTMVTPTRIVSGEFDRWLPVEVSAAIEARLPRADALSCPAPGTSPREDRPDEVAEAIAGFLGRP